MDNIETIDFGIARAAFARHLDTDEGLRTAYAANVQMLLCRTSPRHWPATFWR
jgi:hypothetical protein